MSDDGSRGAGPTSGDGERRSPGSDGAGQAGPGGAGVGGPSPDQGGKRRSMGPFDHPWFLPGLLYVFTLWFAYDGWINSDPDMMEHQTFNRVGAVIWFVGAVYYTLQNLRDQRRARERAASGSQPG